MSDLDTATEQCKVSFYLNGYLVTLEAPDPGLMLIDYLRSPEVALTGPKKPCGQGGCGSCAVVLSRWDDGKQAPVHQPINSCLRPVAALNGLAVTTIEGTGRVDRVMNKVAYTLAKNNGTQCGYCTNGWVMTMTGFLANNPTHRTKQDIENVFDGNLCRCTGMRPILSAMKTFASDWTKEDAANLMACEIDPAFDPNAVADTVTIPFPEPAKKPVPASFYTYEGIAWFEARSLNDLPSILSRKDLPQPIRLVNGNTSYGVYKEEVLAAGTYIDINGIPDIQNVTPSTDGMTIGAGATYTELLDFLVASDRDDLSDPIYYMARRTAGKLVRDAATVGGNVMLMLSHIHEGEPFPSDLSTALAGLDAMVRYVDLTNFSGSEALFEDVVKQCIDNPQRASELLLLNFFVPSQKEAAGSLAQKTALRSINSHSIVNATTRLVLISPIEKGCDGTVSEASSATEVSLIFGGLAPYPWRAVETEKALKGKPLTPDTIYAAIQVLEKEIKQNLPDWAARLKGLPSEGFTDAYKITLAQSFLYRAVINAQLTVAPNAVPPDIRSAGEPMWGKWGVSDGKQSYQTDLYPAPLSRPYIKLMAMHQAQGETLYTHEQTLPNRGWEGAIVQSTIAFGAYEWSLPSADTAHCSNASATGAEISAHLAERFPGFRQLVNAQDLPAGGKNHQGGGGDQPLFSAGHIMYEGQAIALILAVCEKDAQNIAAYVQSHCMTFTDQGDKAVLNFAEAIPNGQIFPDCPVSKNYLAHIWKVTRPASKLDWVPAATPVTDRGVTVQRGTPVDGVPCTVISNSVETGSQLHFYMETQSCLAWKGGDSTLHVRPSTQSPTAVMGTIQSATTYPANQIDIKVPQVGGAYGGKTEQSRFVPAMAAVGALASDRPVRLALSRESDSAMIGRRHPLFGQAAIAVDEDGVIRGFNADMWIDGGAFYDCSFVVADCIQLRIDNAYNVQNYQTQIDVCRTNKAPNTAYRAFGDIQGTLLLESVVEDAAVALQMDPADLREKNLYQMGQSTPGGQTLPYCYLQEVWDYAKKISKYQEKRQSVTAYNAENRWTKRGLCLMPLKYGSGFNLTMLEQASALVSVYSSDASILIRQGGVDMGQGMITMLAQIAAYELNVPLEIIQIEGSDTTVIPNPTSTGASTGTQYNGEAVKQACDVLRKRLEAFGLEQRKTLGEQACVDAHIDFWNYTTGWNTYVDDKTSPSNQKVLIWQALVSMAYGARVNLQAQVNAQIPGGTADVPNVTFKSYEEQPTGTGIKVDKRGSFSEAVNAYVGFTYNAACAEVEVDILTGETKVLAVDIVYDMGKSLNPAIDIGQIEGGFIQGLGYVLTEELVFQETHAEGGPARGTMNTPNTWRYKPPAVETVPLEMNVSLFPRELAKNVPENPYTLLSSKESGEPPLVLANAVFLAIKEAVRASRVERGKSPYFQFDAPATVQAVAEACEVWE